MSQPDRWPTALRARPPARLGGTEGRMTPPEEPKAASAPDMARGEAVELVMSVSRDPKTGRWLVCGDDGSELEDFSTAGAARRWIADRSDE